MVLGIIALFLITILYISVEFNDEIRDWIKQHMFDHFGLETIEDIDFSLEKSKIVIHINGIHLHLLDNNNTQSIEKTKPRRIPKTVLNISIRLICGIAKFIAFHVDNILIEKDNLKLSIDHLFLDSKKSSLLQETALSIGAQIGLVRLYQADIVVFEVTTACLITVNLLLNYTVDLDIKLAKIKLLVQELKHLQQSTTKATTNGTTLRWEEIVNAVRVTVQHIGFMLPQEIVMDVHNVNTVVTCQPTIQLSTDLAQCRLSSTVLFSIPSIEIKASQSDYSSNHAAVVPPHADIISVTCILRSPLVTIPLNDTRLLNILNTQIKNDDQQQHSAWMERIIPDLPMCTFALVFNSPKLQLSPLDQPNGCVTSKSLIIRFAGEYLIKGKNSSADDVPSSSSGSSTNLDALFAQEEYEWLNKGKSQQTAKRWTNIMGRISRHRPNVNPIVPLMTRRWFYRISVKFIFQRFEIGYDDTKELMRIKNAVLIFKSRMNVVLNQTIISLNQPIQSEIAIEKPVVHLWDDRDCMPASLYWVQLLRGNQSKKSRAKTDQQSPLLLLFARNFSFSLDVTNGSIDIVSVDRCHTDNERFDVFPPINHIDNTPKASMITCLTLETQKFTFVCEGPGNDGEWNSRCQMDTLYIQQSSNALSMEEQPQRHVILWISQLNLSAKYNQSSNLVRQSTKIKKYGICYSIRNHYAVLLMVKSLLSLKPNFISNKKADHHVQMNLQVARGDIHVYLPEDTEVYLRLDDFSLHHTSNDGPEIKFRNFMILGVSPREPDAWEQLIEIDKAQINIKKAVKLTARKILTTVPFQYVLSNVIDNLIGLVKSIKDLHGRLLSKDGDYFTLFGPTVNNNPILIPSIKIKTRVFSIQFNDDPFEAKLRNIFRTGLVEQQKRLTYREALDDKIHDMLATSSSSHTSSTINEPILVEENATFVDSPSPIDPEKHQQILDANKNLLEYFSKLWIKNFNQVKDTEAEFYQDLQIKGSYRNDATSKELDQDLDEIHKPESCHFIIDIQTRPLHPPLANFSVQFAKVAFNPADFSLDGSRQFIHTIGGGVPLDNDFSIIIPFHLSIKAGKTWIKARDYPLPLLYVPPPTLIEDDISTTTRSSRNNNRVSWTLEGNYAIADELGNSGGSRLIPIPIVPPSPSSIGYCLLAIRTASPLKFYSVIDYQILTKSMSTICWSVSYNPAIQDIIRVLDTLSSPQADPSPRIGFWDKVRLMIHTRTKFNFIGGGDLAFVVKGTRDPYQLQNRGAGLAKIWSDDVVWLLGYKNPQNEFMQIVSKNYSFGVPDLVHGDYVPIFPDSLQKDSQAQVTNDAYRKFLKVALKLSDGIRMGIGLSYERRACDNQEDVCFNCASAHHLDRCRTRIFSPHYNVIYQSVEEVEMNYDKATYDAFAGFRSDFIHLSLSIVKLQTNDLMDSPDFSKDDPYFENSGTVSQNAMYLSPCFIEHFSHWFKLFGSPISIPIRQGKLFPRDEPKSPSFGEHLNTVKYKIVVSPLAIGYFCTDSESFSQGSAGLKARVNAFSVDIHSRRDIIRSQEEKIVKTEMNFHELEVELHDIDLRVIKLGPKNGRYSSSPTSSFPVDDGASLEDDEITRSYSFQWVDLQDYVILDSVPQQRNPPPQQKISVHPFAFSPLFYYVKQNDESGTEKREYLRGTHDCIIGKGMDSHEFQKVHLNRRASDIDNLIENHDKQLDLILNALNDPKYYDNDIVRDQYNILIDKLESLRTNRFILQNYMAQLILEAELNMTEGSSNRGSPQTTTSSIGRRDELSRWETLMGHFTDRFFIHNPQIIWNNSVRDAIYYWQDIKNNVSVQNYNLSARCLKFLQDLVHTAEKQQQWKPDMPISQHDIISDDVTIDSNVTNALINKLLSERTYNFVAYNEKEEDKSKQQEQYEGIYVFDENSENVNDPDYQYKNIPESYQMKSKYLIDMINPQVNFQSDKGQDHLVLFTNRRIHVKAFGIIDNSSSGAADKEVRLVKDRIIISVDNAQLLVAKRMELLDFNRMTQSSYGQCRNLHWAAWVQPEQLWYYKNVKKFDNFQRIATELSGTIQLDRYNPLRIKINKYNTSRNSPFEDRTNTIQLHFPEFKLTLNSQQSHILYYTLINLLLGNDGSPRKKRRLSKFKDIMLSAERSDLAETVKQVAVLQNRSRMLLDLHKRFLNEFLYLDPVGVREFYRNKKRMKENLEKLYFVVEAIRSIQTFRRDIHLEETDNAMQFCFTSDEIVWEAVMDDNQGSLCSWTLQNIKFVYLDKPNGSSKSTIEVDKMQIKNTTESPVFVNVLDAYMEPGRLEEPDFSRQKMFRGVLESLPPVGGIPVIQHLEINLVPLNLQISTAFGTAMKDYFFPRIISAEEPPTQNSDNNDDDNFNYEEEEYEDIEDPVAVTELKVGSRSSSGTDLLSLGAIIDKSSILSSKREGSFASFELLTQKVKQTVVRKRRIKSDELTIMKKRSSTNRTFIYVRIPAAKHCLSLQGPSQKTLYNLYNFPFKQPKLEYRNKTWSMAEMMEEIQKQFFRAILRHSPALLCNKLLTGSNISKYQQIQPSISAPLSRSSSIKSKRKTPSASSSTRSVKLDVMDDSIIYNINNNVGETETTGSSYQTEDEDANDVKSLYSEDPEEEQERLAESQLVDKRLSINVDTDLLDVYMKKYKQEDEMDENVKKGRILFGDNYRSK